MEERIRSTRSSLAVFVGCCAMSFIGFALITNTSGLYFDAISRDLHVGRAKDNARILAHFRIPALT